MLDWEDNSSFILLLSKQRWYRYYNSLTSILNLNANQQILHTYTWLTGDEGRYGFDLEEVTKFIFGFKMCGIP